MMSRTLIDHVLRKKVIHIFLLCLYVGCSVAQEQTQKLWYKSQANYWKESLPIGNGSLGTMIAGNTTMDTLIINEETMWSGGIHDYSNPQAYSHLDEIRKLILEERYDSALAVGDKYMIGIPKNQQFFQPLGKVIFNFQHANVTNYTRTLDLDSSLVSVRYNWEGYEYRRTYFASYPDNLIVIRLTTNNPKGLDFSISHNSPHRHTSISKNGVSLLEGNGEKARGVDSDIRFASMLKVALGNKYGKKTEGGIQFKGGQEIVFHYTAATNFKRYNDVSGNPRKICETRINDAKKKSFNKLFNSHYNDYTALFSRVEVDFGESKFDDLPTNELIQKARLGNSIPKLDELFYQLGRYLVISGSRAGTQPLNLQGIWNDNMNPPWGCKWTLNINLPMVYWLAEPGNLSECHEPLFSAIYDLKETGTTVAKKHYNCRGFVAHHNTDLWRGAAPVDGANWGLWTFGGAWLTRHLWEHYLFTQDTSFLKRNYIYLKEASLFFFDYLSKGNDKYLVSSPSVSFEQSYRLTDGRFGRLCEGPAMDNQILRDLFSNCGLAATIVGDNEDFIDSLKWFENQLRPTEIDKPTGQLMEWAWPAYPKKISGQIAPLWAVNPGRGINIYDTPELAEAALATIEYREPRVARYETTGSWVSGTRANFWARLHKGDEAYRVYQKTISENIFSNLLVSFYPKKFFMIDGNLGLASAFNEMLVQSQRTNEAGVVIIDLLPALPANWRDGHVKGVKARGGFELDFKWEKGMLNYVTIKGNVGRECKLAYKGELIDVVLDNKQQKTISFNE